MSPEPESRPELDPTIDARESGAELPLSSPPSLAIHRLVLAGRYEILGLLGVGGMGAVYRVRDRSLDELVALKMLRSEHGTTPTLVARFRDEVRLARKVTHRNVARTFDLGEHEGTSFLTMELLEGRSL